MSPRLKKILFVVAFFVVAIPTGSWYLSQYVFAPIYTAIPVEIDFSQLLPANANTGVEAQGSSVYLLEERQPVTFWKEDQSIRFKPFRVKYSCPEGGKPGTVYFPFRGYHVYYACPDGFIAISKTPHPTHVTAIEVIPGSVMWDSVDADVQVTSGGWELSQISSGFLTVVSPLGGRNRIGKDGGVVSLDGNAMMQLMIGDYEAYSLSIGLPGNSLHIIVSYSDLLGWMYSEY